MTYTVTTVTTVKIRIHVHSVIHILEFYRIIECSFRHQYSWILQFWTCSFWNAWKSAPVMQTTCTWVHPSRDEHVTRTWVHDWARQLDQSQQAHRAARKNKYKVAKVCMVLTCLRFNEIKTIKQWEKTSGRRRGGGVGADSSKFFIRHRCLQSFKTSRWKVGGGPAYKSIQ